MRLLVLAAVGGAIGSAARYLMIQAVGRAYGLAFPWGTLSVNVLGSLLMGFLTDMIVRRYDGSVELRTFLATGILGGYTTFSAFSLDAANLINRGSQGAAAIYIVASVAISVLALYAGLALSRALFT